MNNPVSKNILLNGTKVRIRAFDFLKLFAIFLVLWGHSIQYLLSSNHYDEPVFRIIYAFHMPLFMMISGYFSLSSMSHSPLFFIKKKFVQLMLPVFTWVFVLGLVHFLSLTHFSTQSPTLWWTAAKESISYIIHGFITSHPFWFLKSCFYCYLLAYCGSHLRLNKYVWMFLTLIISQLITDFVSFGLMYPCFIVGMELKDNQKFYSNICKHYLWLLGLFVFMLCFWDQFFWIQDGYLKTAIVSCLHTDNMIVLKIFSRLYGLAIGITGSLAFIGLFCSLIPQEKDNKFISLCCNWGQYTLGVYILQYFIYEIFIAKYILLDGINYYLFNIIVAPLLSLIVLVACVNIIKVMCKNPTLALFFYGNKK